MADATKPDFNKIIKFILPLGAIFAITYFYSGNLLLGSLITVLNAALLLGHMTEENKPAEKKIFGRILLIEAATAGLILLFFLTAQYELHPIIITFVFVTYLAFVFAAGGKIVGIPCFMIIFILSIAGYFFPIEDMFILDSRGYEIIAGQKQLVKDAIAAIKTGAEQSQVALERQKSIISGDYEQGVEANVNKNLGVFLDNIGTVSPRVRNDEVIDVYATLRAEAFQTGKPLGIFVKCCLEDGSECVEEGEIKPTPQFSVEEFERTDIDCIIDLFDKNPTKGQRAVKLSADFDFTTDAFLKTYFMKQENVQAFRRTNTNPTASPLEEFGITDKNPVAIYTPGPMKIGMGVAQQPIQILEAGIGPTIGITLEKNWLDGKLVGMNELEIITPAGIEIESISGKGKDVLSQYCRKTESQEHQCIITGEFLQQIYPKDTTIQNFRIQTKITSPELLLGDAALGIRSVKARANYRYSLEKRIDVTITEMVTA